MYLACNVYCSVHIIYVTEEGIVLKVYHESWRFSPDTFLYYVLMSAHCILTRLLKQTSKVGKRHQENSDEGIWNYESITKDKPVPLCY